jgi:hypothetical protein
MKVGDLIRFTKEHSRRPGLDYTMDWVGVLVQTTRDASGELDELHILWNHGKVSDYPASWWKKYEPFEVIK